MSLKQEQIQQQTQHLSTQQIHLLKLIALPSTALDAYVEEIISENPALEEDPESLSDSLNDSLEDRQESPQYTPMHAPLEWVENKAQQSAELSEHLLEQLNFLDLNTTQKRIAYQLIGSLDDSGYLRRPLQSVINDLLINEGLDITLEEIEAVLKQVQNLEPAGVASRDLQECLRLQLHRQPPSTSQETAYQIIDNYYEDFVQNRRQKIQERLKISTEAFQEVLQHIKRLSPKPGASYKPSNNTAVVADFALEFIENPDDPIPDMHVRMLRKPRKWVRVSTVYKRLYQKLQQQKEKNKADQDTKVFIRKQVEGAQSFMQALQQREGTLLRVVQLIVARQRTFLESQDPLHLKPLILKDIAEQVNMDISTISRIVNKKYLETNWGILPLRALFSQANTESVSNAHIKEVVRNIIAQESKTTPLSDESLVEALEKLGYKVARRTVAKYRAQLLIPTARLRKEMP